MFRGVVPSSVRKILHESVLKWDARDIYIGCSGNFTLERMISEIGDYRIHGCDMSLHSSALGYYYTGEPLKVVFNPKVDGFDWLEPFTRTPEGMLACILVSGNFELALDRTGHIKENSYWKRLMQAYQSAFPELHQKTVTKILADPFVGKLTSYTCGDVVDYVEAIPKVDKSAFISFPPFESYDAGKEYVDRSIKFESFFEWRRPEIQLLKADRMKHYRQHCMAFKNWAFGCNLPEPMYEGQQIGQVKETNRGKTIYVYGSQEVRRLVQPHQKTARLGIPKLSTNMKIGDKVYLAPLAADIFTALRSQYMNQSIVPSGSFTAYGVVIEGLLVGCYAFAAPAITTRVAQDGIYMLSDFPVAPTDYPRLSKLILYAALSKESKLLAERFRRRRIRFMSTTAFTNEVVSMKYRGLFKVEWRKENPHYDPNDPQSKKHQIQYSADLGQWSLAEGLELWKQKHAN